MNLGQSVNRFIKQALSAFQLAMAEDCGVLLIAYRHKLPKSATAKGQWKDKRFIEALNQMICLSTSIVTDGFFGSWIKNML